MSAPAIVSLSTLDWPALAAAGGPVTAPIPYVMYFLFVSFVVALVTSAIRDLSLSQVFTETRKFFVTIVLVIAFFAALVFVLEWVFIRPLI